MVASRLHRKISPQGKHIFALTIGAETFTDSAIHSIVINRGAAGFSYGVQPATLEAEIRGLHPTLFHRKTDLTLTDWAAAHLSTLTGKPASTLKSRFTGQIGSQNSTDRGRGKVGTTRITAASYSALLKPSSKRIIIESGQSVKEIIAAAFNANNLNGNIKIYSPTPNTPEFWDTAYIPEGKKEMTFKEIISAYAEALMTLCTDRRDGTIYVRPLLGRHNEIATRIKEYAPLRSNTLSPAEYAQPVDMRSTSFVQLETLKDGTSRRRIWPAYAPTYVPETPIEETEIDFTHIYRLSQTSDTVVKAKQFQNNWPRLNLTRIKLDLLMLLSSKREYDRRLAGQLLVMEHGDPLYFAGDWTYANPGTLIAQKITETITPNEWSLTIDLEHPIMLLGRDALHPTPIVWEQAGLEKWDTTDRPWEG